MSEQSAQYGSQSASHSGSAKHNADEYYPHHHKKYDNCDSKISPWGAYLIWLIVLIVLIWILRSLGINWFSAVGFSLLVAGIVLCAIYPSKRRHGKYTYCSNDALFCLIILITIIVLIIWFIWKVFTDREAGSITMVHEKHCVKEQGVEGDVNYQWQATVDTPKAHTVAAGSGTIHRTPHLGSLAPASSSYASHVTPVTQMGGVRSAAGPF